MGKPNTRDIHVLHVVPGLGVGGMELALSRVANALVARGQRHSVACLKGEADIADRFDPRVCIYRMHAGANDLFLPWRLWRLIRQVKPTVIHARNWGAWPDVALARLIAWRPVPLIFSFHGQAEIVRMPLRQRLASRLLGLITTRAFTVAEGAKRVMVEEMGLSPHQVAVIPNGVDTERFFPASTRLPPPRLVIGTVGRLGPVKNQRLLIHACGDLVARGLNLEVRIAGDGPEKENLLAVARASCGAERVRFLGHVSDVPQFLQGLDVFVLPSKSEAHPNALLEAMACGLPCVATRVGGVPEVLDEGQAGLLVPPEDQAALAAALHALVTDPARRVALGHVARQRACSHYSLASMLDAYAALYRAIATRPRLAPAPEEA